MEKAKKRKADFNDSFEEEQPQFVSISRKNQKGGPKKSNKDVVAAAGNHLDHKKGSSSEVTDTTKRRVSRIDGDFVKETWDTNRADADDPMMGGGAAKKSGLFVPSVKKREKSDAIFNKGSGMLNTRTATNRNIGEHDDKKT